jgi:hypothetical protein
MIIATLAILSGQFDFGDGPIKTSPRPTRTYAVGQDLMSWDVVKSELHLPVWGTPMKTLEKPAPESEPILTSGFWRCGGVIDFGPSAYKLRKEDQARLAQIYVQFRGSAAILEPRIAAKLQLTDRQKAMVVQIDKRCRAQLGGSLRWLSGSLFTKRQDTVDYKIANHIRFMASMRRTSSEGIAGLIGIRKACRELLTTRQRAVLTKLGGKPLRSSFHETWPTIMGSFDYSDPSEARKGLQRDGIFSVLRHDIATKIGVSEEQVDRIAIGLKDLYLMAYRDADEYWWLLKRQQNRPRIFQLRQAVFSHYEVQARQMIRRELRADQRSKWDRMVGMPIPGVLSRNHFG